MERTHYGAIDGLRTIACIGIVMMHMASNNAYEISGFIYNTIISSFTHFTSLFMVISAFGMCCGYYERMLNNKVDLTSFYSKRFKKIFPFFALLVLLDVVLSPSVGALYEAFADLTLLFGFLPGAGNISVIGVGWFLGLIFVFYICFPFFCVLIKSKRRAWLVFGLSLAYNFVCINYFDVRGGNIIYNSCFFLLGGFIYLYREKILTWNRWIALAVIPVSIVVYYTIGNNTITKLIVSTALLIYAVISAKGDGPKSYILENKVTKFISGISMEIYLSHMLIFRVIEKAGLNRMFGTGWVQYLITVILVLIGTVIFSAVLRKVIGIAENRINQYTAKRAMIGKVR